MKDENKKPPEDLKQRTKRFALRVIRLYSALPTTEVARVLGKQVLRSGTSVGAQYREGVRSRSDAEIISKWSGALQELEETSYWFELLAEGDVVPANLLADLMRECDELTAILTTCVKNVKARKHV
ncbi:MAG: four helix bundle protein [Planctomycetaceae bacterium]|nr:four helix bundle protein [Planctomycetaceae bacterium]